MPQIVVNSANGDIEIEMLYRIPREFGGNEFRINHLVTMFMGGVYVDLIVYYHIFGIQDIFDGLANLPFPSMFLYDAGDYGIFVADGNEEVNDNEKDENNGDDKYYDANNNETDNEIIEDANDNHEYHNDNYEYHYDNYEYDNDNHESDNDVYGSTPSIVIGGSFAEGTSVTVTETGNRHQVNGHWYNIVGAQTRTIVVDGIPVMTVEFLFRRETITQPPQPPTPEEEPPVEEEDGLEDIYELGMDIMLADGVLPLSPYHMAYMIGYQGLVRPGDNAFTDIRGHWAASYN